MSIREFVTEWSTAPLCSAGHHLSDTQEHFHVTSSGHMPTDCPGDKQAPDTSAPVGQC